jgi:hypothetical protein
MNRPELYFTSSRFVLEGYRKETLLLDDWGTCAIANIIAGINNYDIRTSTEWGLVSAKWVYCDKTIPNKLWGKILTGNFIKRIQLHYTIGEREYDFHEGLLRSSGYNNKELKYLMDTFDTAESDESNLKPALQATVMALRKIHKVRFALFSVEEKKRFIRQNKQLRELAITRPLMEQMYYPNAYVDRIRFSYFYKQRTRLRIWIGIYKRKITEGMLCHLLKGSLSATTLQCIIQHIGTEKNTKQSHEIITRCNLFDCIPGSPMRKRSGIIPSMRYVTESA